LYQIPHLGIDFILCAFWLSRISFFKLSHFARIDTVIYGIF